MTDNEIKKADEQLIKWWENEIHLAKCFDSDYRDGITVEYIKSTLDLINRKQVEIERLKAEVKKLKSDMSYMVNPNTIGDRHEMGCW